MSFVSLSGVSKSYGTGARHSAVLCDVNLTVERGEFVAVVGFSGAGKTTLLSMIAGLVAPDRGTIKVAGKAAGRRTLKSVLVRESFRTFATFR